MRRGASILAAVGLATLAAAVPGDAAAPGRAYEMVSPLDKNGGDIDRDLLSIQIPLASQSGAAPSGDAVAFVSRAAFADIGSGAFFPNYVAERGDGGWKTFGVSPPGDNVTWPGLEIVRVSGFSADLSTAFVSTPRPLTPDAATLNGSWGLYMRKGGASPQYTLLSLRDSDLPDTPDNLGFESTRFEYEASTPDARHVVFNASRQLLPSAPGDSINERVSNAVYEWVDGNLRLVSVPPVGLSLDNSIASTVVGSGSERLGVGEVHGEHAISDDGNRVFFTSTLLRADGTSSGRRLMVREGGASTTVVSAAEQSGGDALPGTGDAQFWGARASDGGVALFYDKDPLTDEAGQGSLYRWDASADEGSRLTEISQDDPLVKEPLVQGAAAVTDDATTAYFVALGVLAGPGSIGAPTRGQPNLYRWKEGEGIRFIATLDPPARDGHVWTRSFSAGGKTSRLSADGQRLLFASFADLDPSYDNTEATPEACGDLTVAGEPCAQLYVYDAPTDSISCLTCVPGAPVTDNADLFGNTELGRQEDAAIVNPVRLSRNLSADGTKVFFETKRALLPQDVNGELDVYTWEDGDRDGEGDLHLISTGTSVRGSQFVDASESGDNVFFTTFDKLVGIDTDNHGDLYDARVGGGIAAQNPLPAPPPCDGEACQGSPSSPPIFPAVPPGGSDGDVDPGPRPAFSVARLSRAQRARLAEGKSIGIRVRVNKPGRVSLAAHATVDRRKRTVATDSARAGRAGVVTLSLKLSRSARNALAEHGRLRVGVAVKFAGVREAKGSTVTLRRATNSKKGRAR